MNLIASNCHRIPKELCQAYANKKVLKIPIFLILIYVLIWTKFTEIRKPDYCELDVCKSALTIFNQTEIQQALALTSFAFNLNVYIKSVKLS